MLQKSNLITANLMSRKITTAEPITPLLNKENQLLIFETLNKMFFQ